MKTNHRRNFVAKRSRRHCFESFSVFSKLANKSIGASFSHGSRREEQHMRRGAKKFVRTRLRFHENAATIRLARSI
jgi:hypothetical protein